MKFLTVLIAFFSLLQANAKCDKDGLTIMKEQDKKQSVKTEEESQEIVILDVSSNKKEKRTLQRYQIKKGEKDTKGLLYFNDPATIKGAGLLNWKSDGSENQWLYVPELKKLTRIAGGSKKNYFMGTDFTYADLEGEDLDKNDYTCMQEVKCQKGKSSCYVIQAKPKSEEQARNIGYQKRMLLVDKKELFTLKIVFYNLKGQKLKTAEYANWTKVGNVWRPDLAIMDRHGVQKTFIRVLSRKLDQKVDEVVFTKRYLQKEMHIK